MSTQQVETSKDATAGDGTIQYRAVSGLAVLALALGVLSAAAMVGPVLWSIPILAAIVALIAMRRIRSSEDLVGWNIAFLGLLYMLMATPQARAGGLFAGLAATPGLHLALGIASALASYVNLGLLWRWLRRDGVYQPLPGWGRYLLRMLAACVAMAVAVLAIRAWAGDWAAIADWRLRVGWLLLAVGAGAGAYGIAQLALGLRPRHLRH